MGLGRQEAPRGLQDAPRGPQEGPRRPKMAPRRPQDAPKRAQRRPQDAPSPPQDGTKTAPSPQDAPRHPQEGPKRAQDAPKTPQDTPKRAPRHPQDAQSSYIRGHKEQGGFSVQRRGGDPSPIEQAPNKIASCGVTCPRSTSLELINLRFYRVARHQSENNIFLCFFRFWMIFLWFLRHF